MTMGLEKHVQTAIQVILVGITIWVGNSILILRDASIRTEEKNVQLRESIIELKGDIASLRSSVASTAEKNLAIQQTLKSLDDRIDELERRQRSR